MTYDEQRAYALLCFWMGDNRRTFTGLRGDALFHALYTGVHAVAEASSLPDAVVRRMIRVAMEAIEAPAGEEVDGGKPRG